MALISILEPTLRIGSQLYWFLFSQQTAQQGRPLHSGATIRYSGAQRHTVGRTVALSVSAVGRNFVAKAFT